jgi:hypothetical protein
MEWLSRILSKTGRISGASLSKSGRNTFYADADTDTKQKAVVR